MSANLRVLGHSTKTPNAWFKDISGSWLCNQTSCYQQRKHSSLLCLGLAVIYNIVFDYHLKTQSGPFIHPSFVTLLIHLESLHLFSQWLNQPSGLCLPFVCHGSAPMSHAGHTAPRDDPYVAPLSVYHEIWSCSAHRALSNATPPPPLHCAVLSVLPSCMPTDRDTKGSMYSPESRTGFHLCVFACALPSAGIASASFVSSVRRLPRKCNRQNWQASQNIQLCSVSLIYVSSALCGSLWPQPHNSLFPSFSCMELGTACVGRTNLRVQYIVVAQ